MKTHKLFHLSCKYSMWDIPEVPRNITTVERKNNEIDSNCVICFTESRQYFARPCMHLTHCSRCHARYDDDKCMICRQKVKRFEKVFV